MNAKLNTQKRVRNFKGDGFTGVSSRRVASGENLMCPAGKRLLGIFGWRIQPLVAGRSSLAIGR
jgi:hypothetical protein